jgi:hypothetical protein
MRPSNLNFAFILMVLTLLRPPNGPLKCYMPRPSRPYKTNPVAFSPQANYTDGATATYWRNFVPTFADRGMSEETLRSILRPSVVLLLSLPAFSIWISKHVLRMACL